MSDLNQRWAAHIVGTAVACGIRDAVICPGSRSTPLAIAFADRQDVKVWSIIDERSAAFFALGRAKKTNRPVAVVCTSGSAGAHFLPALMEAHTAHVPLLVLTADRPWELQGFGAPQTVDQSNLYGGFVRGKQLLPSPEDSKAVFAHLQEAIVQLMSAAVNVPRGPVHLNVPFREPLAPEIGAEPCVVTVAPQALVNGRSLIDLEQVSAALKSGKSGVIVCGPRHRPDDFGAAVHALGKALNYPVIAEATSNARFGFPQVIWSADLMLRNVDFAREMRPDVILKFGTGLTSKVVQNWVDESGAQIFQFSDEGDSFDPQHRSTRLLSGDVVEAVRRLVNERSITSEYRLKWLRAQELVHLKRASLDEPAVAREVLASLPPGASLMVSSSMPIRDVDTFAAGTSGPVQVFCNRGLNGIDGIISTALGVAADSKTPTVLLIGDVATLHDLNALLIARRYRMNLTIVLVNNDGGGIFHFLPVADRTAHFEELFGTPHGVDFAHVAAMAGATYHQPTTIEAFRKVYSESLETGLNLIEVKTDRVENVKVHRALQQQVNTALEVSSWR